MEPAGPVPVKVWDPLVRIAHWTLVASVALAWFSRTGGHLWHQLFGYTALVTVAIRVLWGFIGPDHARFASFVCSAQATLRYARLALVAREPRHIGHNPLGACMIVVLLVNITLIGLSGWLYTTTAFWGVEWVDRLHAWLSYLLLGLISLHVGGVLLASMRHRENLAAAMLHGRKRSMQADPKRPS